MKKIKKKHLLMFCLPLVIAGSIFSIVTMVKNDKDTLNYEFVVDMSEKNYRKVYLLDENKYLIPLSLEVANTQYLVDEIYTVISNLRDLKVEGFTSTIPENVKINKIELENGILNIDFSKEFLDYQANLEEKIIESLTWSVMDFEQVNGLTISVEGVKLTKMPINGLVLPNVLNKDIGINKYHDLTTNFELGDSVIVMYQKTINDKEYYVPVTKRIETYSDVREKVINSIDDNIAIFSGLKQIEVIKSLNINDISYNDSKVSVNLDEDHLIEDNLVDSELYKILMLSLHYNNIDAQVGFYIDNESVEVNGYNNTQEESVNNIVFNEIEI